MRVCPVNPLDHASGIKELFRAHETPQFAAYFDRVYEGAVAGGARSWIGIDDGGELVMHMACFVNRFLMDGSPVSGGLLANFMVATRHRTVTPALTLARQLVRDTRDFGDLDFLYTNPNAASHAVLGLAGLKPVAQVERFVYPTQDANPLLHLATAFYQFTGRALAGFPSGAPFTTRPADDAVGRTPASAARAGRLTPLRTIDQLARRMPGFPAPEDQWLVSEREGRARAAFLLGRPDEASNMDLQAAWSDGDLNLARLLPQVAGAARSRGAHRLVAWSLAESSLARELARGGFRARGIAGPLDAIPLTPLGERVVAAASQWDLHGIDLDGGIA